MTQRGWGLGRCRRGPWGAVLARTPLAALRATLCAALLGALLVGCTSAVAGRPTAAGAGDGSSADGAPAGPAQGACALLTPEEVAAVIGPGPAGVSLPGTDLENCTWVGDKDENVVALTLAPPGDTDLGPLEAAGLGAVFTANGRSGLVRVISSTKNTKQESAKLAELIKGRL